MTKTEERAQLMELANRLAQRRTELLETVNLINKGICLLVDRADDFLIASLDEKGPTGKKLPVEVTPDDIANFEKPGRKCSLCHEPGHTARTCPNGRREEPVKEKKKRKPMSEERKQALREALVKARAARKKKQ